MLENEISRCAISSHHIIIKMLPIFLVWITPIVQYGIDFFLLQSLKPDLIGYGLGLGFAGICYLIFVTFHQEKSLLGAKNWNGLLL